MGQPMGASHALGGPPLVSVVCTAYNRGPAIRSTLESVLAQTIADLELLVVSDGSTDDTDQHVLAVAADDARVRLLQVANGGAPRAMNIGVEEARAPYIAYIDHDDWWTPVHLELLVSELEAGADLAASNSTWLRPDGSVLSERPVASLFWHPDIQVINPVFENSQAIHRAELLDEVGPWREDDFGLEDWDLWLRMADAGARVATVAERTVLETMGGTANRYRTLTRRYASTLLVCPDQLAARRALRAMTSPQSRALLDDAVVSDSEAWYEGLAQTEAFVFPRGYARTRTDAVAGLSAALRASREADRGLEDPVSIRLVEIPEGVAIVRELEVMTQDHAVRHDALARKALPRYYSLLAAITADASSPTATAPKVVRL